MYSTPAASRLARSAAHFSGVTEIAMWCRRPSSGNAQLDADVAAGGARVRAHLVGRLGELARLLPLEPGDVDDQRDHQAVAPVLGPDAHPGGHGRIAGIHLGPAGHDSQGAV